MLMPFGVAHAVAQLQVGSVPEIVVFLFLGLIFLAAIVFLALLVFSVVVRALGLKVPRESLSKLVNAVGEKHRLVIAGGFVLTLVFGIPSFGIAMYDGANADDKKLASAVLRWLLQGWGFGSGFAFLALLFGRRAPDADGQSAGATTTR